MTVHEDTGNLEIQLRSRLLSVARKLITISGSGNRDSILSD
jgi:hypothetical protein